GSLEMVCGSFETTAPCMVARTPAYVRWRFGGASSVGYRHLLRGDAGVPDALAVVRSGQLLGRRVLFLMEFMAAPDDRSAAAALATAVIHEAEREEAAAVVGYFPPHSPLFRALRPHGFREAPRWMRPRPYTVWAATDERAPEADELASFGLWHMSLSDSDLA
ncbi:MAG TPA: hypothetical protein VJ144_07955, partial [Candidatus Polarisedimenticolia bacterium]|nr:hypothetical protein [Candidatus Polarisedimenticolia bacterium]